MTPRLIALDLDGTTLNDQGELSQRTIKTLKAAQAAGHRVVIATGRPDSISTHFYQQLELTSPMINFNGALIHRPGKEWAHEQAFGIERDLALGLLELKRNFAIRVMIAEGKNLLLADHPYQGIPFLPDLPHPEVLFDADGLDREPISVTLFIDGEQLASLQDAVAQQFPMLTAKTWGAWSGEFTALEVTTQAASKSRGVAYVADLYGIEPAHIIAFGDDLNDLDMLEYAGTGVAMQNAREEIKAVADVVTPLDHDQDGVADFLQNYLNLAG